ncbi:hypothetical protein HDF08_001993 [Edaphobacter lichenicola]|uniref:Uncharacterized protein n=1 Tax=Tunturiibacter lichenicola TaxID=2051959 RepID=A0A852VK82_9BACT|nr:hypothetical protein [Edaphobacter lichenicola]
MGQRRNNRRVTYRNTVKGAVLKPPISYPVNGSTDLDPLVRVRMQG